MFCKQTFVETQWHISAPYQQQRSPFCRSNEIENEYHLLLDAVFTQVLD